MNDLLTHPVVLAEIAIVCVLLLAVVIVGRSISLRVGSVHAELRPNGGHSLRDALDRLERKVDHAVRKIGERLDELEGTGDTPRG